MMPCHSMTLSRHQDKLLQTPATLETLGSTSAVLLIIHDGISSGASHVVHPSVPCTASTYRPSDPRPPASHGQIARPGRHSGRFNLPGITPSMLALSMPYGRILTAAKLHRLRILVQLQRNLHQHWCVHFSPPPLDFNLM